MTADVCFAIIVIALGLASLPIPIAALMNVMDRRKKRREGAD